MKDVTVADRDGVAGIGMGPVKEMVSVREECKTDTHRTGDRNPGGSF